MKLENPHLKELQQAIRDGDETKRAELEQKSREFIEQNMKMSFEGINKTRIEVDETIQKIERMTPVINKEDRKIIKQIYKDAIEKNRYVRDVLVKETIEIKRLCREILFPNQKDKNMEE